MECTTTPIAETFDDVEAMIWSMAYKLQRKYQIPKHALPDLYAEGCLAFVVAYRRYRDYERKDDVQFTTFLQNKIFYWMTTYIRNEARAIKRVARALELAQTTNGRPIIRPGALVEYMETLSDDAQFVVGLVLKSPVELTKAMRIDCKKATQTSMRKGLRKYLAEELGWQRKRIANVFAELGDSLSGKQRFYLKMNGYPKISIRRSEQS